MRGKWCYEYRRILTGTKRYERKVVLRVQKGTYRYEAL
jgi:hypothetical protein